MPNRTDHQSSIVNARAHTQSPAQPSGAGHSSTPPLHIPQNSPDIPQIPPDFFQESTSHRRNKIANLSPEDQHTLLDWMDSGLTYLQIVEQAAQPRPFGIETKLSPSMLCRFHQKHGLAEQLQDAVELAREITPDGDPEAALRLLAQAYAMRTLSSPGADTNAFHKVTRYFLRLEDQRIRQRALDLQQKRLAFEMQHKHYDIFKRTVQKLPEINRIVRDQSLTPEERMREFWIQQFGVESVEMVDEANEKYRREHPNEPSTEPDINEDDLIPPLTPEEQQRATNEGLDVLMGPAPENYDDDQPNPAPHPSHPSNATYSTPPR